MSVKNLFICGTPLQSLIIKKIVKDNGLKKDDCALFFYTYDKNSKHNYYYNSLKGLFSDSLYYLSDNKYPRYLIESKRYFSRLDAENVYAAAVTSSFVLMAFSVGRRKNIYTFDDGAANIAPQSPYAARYGLTLKKYLALGLFGNRYNITRIRNESLGHYTIYPDFKNNMSSNLIPINVFPKVERGKRIEKCSLVLGTVEREVFLPENMALANRKISRFVRSIEGAVYYLPHPRSMDAIIEGCTLVETDKIAEEVIGELYERFGELDLYGFCSSAQINMAHLNGLRNFFFSCSEFRFSTPKVFGVADESGISLGSMIDLDDYAN